MKGFIQLVILALFMFCSANGAAGEVIFQRTQEEPIGSGVKYRFIQRFNTNGWVTAHILEVDLNDQHTSIKALTPQELSRRDTLLNMVNNQGALGGINGDFFITEGINSFPIGPVVVDGNLLKQPMYTNTMGVFSVMKNGQLHIDRWTYKGEIISSTGGRVPISHINMTSSTYQGTFLFTPHFGKELPSNIQNQSDIVIIEVRNGRVTRIDQNKGIRLIPGDGYILVGAGSHGAALLQNMAANNAVTLNLTTTPNWETISSAIGGGSILIKNGVIVPFTHNITGRHPRSAVAFNQSKLFLVTIDGRTQSSIGMTQDELARFLLDELNATHAINLDGGGSSTLVASTVFSPGPVVLSGASSQRMISNGLGIFQDASLDYTLNSIIFSQKSVNMVPGVPYPLEIKGVNRFYNDLNIPLSSYNFSVSGVMGNFASGRFTPTSQGKGIIKAQYNNISGQLPIFVIGEPQKLELIPSSSQIGTNQVVSFNVMAVDGNGYLAKLPNDQIKWETIGNIGHISKEGILNTAAASGSGYVKASFGNLTALSPVAVGYREEIITSFEENSFSFTGFPVSNAGGYTRVDKRNPVKDGEFSGQLVYDFNQGEGTRAAYILFPGKGLPVSGTPSRFGLWVYSLGLGEPWLRGFILDGDGNRHTIDFADKLDWTGWRWVEARVPSGIKGPIKFERLYVVETDPLKRYWGAIYVDQLTAIYPYPLPIVDNVSIIDSLIGKPSQYNYSISLWGPTGPIDNIYKSALVGLGTSKFSQDLFSIGLEPLPPSIAGKFEGKYISMTGNYRSQDLGGIRIINLETAGRSLLTAKDQWKWLLDELNKPASIIIIKGETSPLNFKDKMEGELLKDILAEAKDSGKDIFYMYPDTSNNIIPDRGVRYIGMAGILHVNDEQQGQNRTFVRLYIDKGKVTGLEFINIVK